jgi:hypothetical protein
VLLATTIGPIVVLDGALDQAQPERFQVEVLNRGPPPARRQKGRLQLAAWGPVAQPEWAEVPARVYAAAQVGAPIEVQLRPGVLGLRWYRLEVPPPHTP